MLTRTSAVSTLNRLLLHDISGSLQISTKHLILSLRKITHTVSNMLVPQIRNVFNDIVKSEEDKRLYRGLELSNGLKVLLISDPKTDKSSAALDVHIGHMSDPNEIPGLAHFCEHMLFLGTTKYPVENEYNKYLSEHSGNSNAFTTVDHTNYYFDVAPEHLEGVLDRFAQFFLSPLFTESATEREINAVNSEHEKNIQIDLWRLNQLERSTSNPKHAYNKFGTGNKKTLDENPRKNGINIREKLLKFHYDWYSANIMAFALLGKESLDELQVLATNLFSGVINKNVQTPEWKDHPFSDDCLKKRAFVMPVKDIRNLNISFPIPDLQPYYKTNPGSYLGHLIGHEGPGSLLSELKAKGWVNTLIGGQKSGAKGFGFFIVNVDLTEDGIEHVDDIVTHLFQYLNMLRHNGPQEWFFREFADINKITFRFKDKEKPQTYTCTLAGLLHMYPMEEVLCGAYLMPDYNPDHINMVLEKLIPEKIRIAVVGKKYQSVVNQTELWYGTEYYIEDIPEETLEKWKNAGFNNNFSLPPRNEFIPTNFELVSQNEEKSPLPQLLKNSPITRLWYKQDDEYLLPKAVLNFEFVSPLAYLDPLHCDMAYMLVQLFRDSLTEYSYAAELAGLGYSLSNTKYGMILYIKGYNDKQHILLGKIMDILTNFEIDPKRFDILKEAYIRGLKNFQAEQPHQHAVYYSSVLLAEHAWTKEELLEATDDLTLDKMHIFIKELLSKIHIEALIHGNISKQKAFELVTIIESKLQQNMKSKPLLPSQLIRDREVQLSNGSSYLFKCTNSVHSSSCIIVYYQSGLQETHLNVVLELFCQIIAEPCFNILRTQEQLGYIVFSGVRRANGAQGIHVVVQSDRNPDYLNERIEAFLLKMKNYMNEMTEDQFQKHREALVCHRLEKPKKMAHRTAKFWTEIASQQYNFDRDNIEVAHLKTLTKNDILEFYDKLIAYDAPLRHKLAVHIISTATSGIENEIKQNVVTPPSDGTPFSPELNEHTVIQNITEFKSSHPLFPLVRPYIDLSNLTKAKL
uniref:Insulin-degrading enzyme n=1 Tax=Hemiscolopendra marginata TaxID=943146 RepID=A0A646QDK3_9MYRI